VTDSPASLPALIGRRGLRGSGWAAARRPPRLRTVEDVEGRHASALELFFDLVFVVAVAELGETLSHNTSAVGYLQFAFLFVPVWWAWVGYTFYSDRFDTDDLVLRLAMFAAMLAVVWLAVEIPRVFEDPAGAARFAAAYACVRLVLVGLYLRADYHEPRARPLTFIRWTGWTWALRRSSGRSRSS
jgi:low temperature requirement protein LtrA